MKFKTTGCKLIQLLMGILICSGCTKNEWQIVIANPYNEHPHGEWNTLEVICWENHAVHMINGKVNLIVLNSFYLDDGQKKHLQVGD